MNNFTESKGGKIVPVNEDSVLLHFEEALDKLDISFYFDTIRNNHCDNNFHRNFTLKERKIDRKKIIQISSSSSEKFVMVPVIYFDNTYKNQIYFLSSGIPAGGDVVRNTYLQIAIYLVKDSEVVYFKSVKHLVLSRHEDFEEEPKRQTQENWDKLVEMVMRDYIKRLR